jgi:hypothetical protein
MARPRKYSDEQLVAALEKSKGVVYHAAKMLGCEADTFYYRAGRCPDVKAAMRNERSEFVDLGESQLYKAVAAGEPWAVRLVVTTLGKDRGYVERTEVEQSGQTRLVVEEEVVTRADRPPEVPALPDAGRVPPQ